MHIRNSRNLIAGIGLATIAIVFWYQVSALPLIRGTSLGSGGLPKISAGCLVLCGLYLIVISFLRSGETVERVPFSGILSIVAAVVVFAGALDHLGLFITGAIAALIAGLGAPDRRWKELLVFPLLLSGFCTILFVWLLGISLPIWPDF